jgi:hypothetical protein
VQRKPQHRDIYHYMGCHLIQNLHKGRNNPRLSTAIHYRHNHENVEDSNLRNGSPSFC